MSAATTTETREGDATDDVAWSAPASPPALAPGDVHVWLARLPDLVPHEIALHALLDDAERARASRFHFAADRARHVASHGALRTLLSRYVDVPAPALRFETGEQGKPRLAGASLEFNLSHSADLLLVAVTSGAPVGVDVERWTPGATRAELDDLAAFAFSPRERATLAALPETLHTAGFFAAWSRKEAYIKATGHGVSRGLDHFDVELDPRRPARLLADRLDPRGAADWRLRNIAAPSGYSAALALDATSVGSVRLLALSRTLLAL